ncbi:MAG: hypothetical protein ABL893_18775, partial [Hyphomicrobium sp.]
MLQSAGNRSRAGYEALYAQLTTVTTVRSFREALPKLVSPRLPKGEILDLLLLAENAAQRHQWQSAAQLYSYVIILGLGFTWENEELLVHHANRLIQLTRQHNAELKSKTDLLLYAYKRLSAALRADGIRAAQQAAWITTSIAEFAASSKVRMDGARAALAHLEQQNLPETSKYRGYATHANAVLNNALDQLAEIDKEPSNHNGQPFRNIVFLGIIALLTGCIAWLSRDAIAFPQSSSLFRGPNVLGAALLWWPLLLVATWIFALLESKRTQTLNYIGAQHLRGKHALVAGELMPFAKDWFFHIFQFVWVPYLVIANLLMAKFEVLPKFLQANWRPAAEG